MTKTKRLTLSVVALLFASFPAWADSQARAVRLSSIDGTVKIDRNVDQGFENAISNLPITEGAQLQTGNDGRAEVEFEDGSTLRLTPGTTVEFTELSLRDSGAKSSAISVRQGTAYLDFRPDKDFGHEMILSFGRQSVNLRQKVRMRVQVSDADTTVAVFKGAAEVESASGVVKVESDRSVTFDAANHDDSTVADKITESPFDDWDREQGKYHDQYMARNSGSDYAGVSDLNYYGNYSNVPGYGMLWQPYFVGPGWDPFMDGAWAYYPGYGYSWVSAYPWGWAPYHCGAWQYVPSFGWGWQRGGCSGFWGFPTVVNPPVNFSSPRPPTRTPVGGGIIVKRRPLIPSSEFGGKVRIQRDTAGLGIPRGAVRDMSKISREVRQNGMATTNIRVSPIMTMPMPANNAQSPRATSTPSKPAQPSSASNPSKPRMTPPSSSRPNSSFGGMSNAGGSSRPTSTAPSRRPK